MRSYFPIACALAGCAAPGEGRPPLAARAFPVGVAVASPFGYRVAPLRAPEGGPEVTPQAGTLAPEYALATARLADLLRGATPASCRFDPAPLLGVGRDARCYGPAVPYEAHPDALGASDPGYSGALPAGDVGLWRAEEPGPGPDAGQACAAAQLNARLGGVADQSLGALGGLASLVCTAVATGQALPASGALDLTDEMNAQAAPGVRFTAATLSRAVDAAGAERYGYALALRFTPAAGSGGPGAGPLSVRVELTHAPGAADDSLGRLSYRVSGAGLAPGCAGPTGARLGSLRYRREGGALTLEARAGAFCGDGADGFTDGLVDPRKKLDGTRGSGWSDDFGVFLAAFDRASLRGSYAYAWQAGPLDGSSRVLDVSVGPGEGGEAARAFYGHGPDIAAPGGAVAGMICSWAGPRSSRALRPAAQYQAVALDPGRGLFAPLVSRLRYAPTASCGYDGRGAFRYDSDGDGAIDTDAALPVTSDLAALTDADGDGRPDELARSGFVLPAPPPGL